MAAGTKDDPWVLKTPPGSSEYTMYKDEKADPPALVCQVGSTTLKYHLRAIDDLHAWLVEQGDWVVLGAADEKKDAAPGTVEAWGGRRTTPWGGGTDCATAIGVASGCTCPRCSRRSGWPRSPTIPATTRCGRSARDEEMTMAVTKVIRYKTKPERPTRTSGWCAPCSPSWRREPRRVPLRHLPARRRRQLRARGRARRRGEPVEQLGRLRRVPVRAQGPGGRGTHPGRRHGGRLLPPAPLTRRPGPALDATVQLRSLLTVSGS